MTDLLALMDPLPGGEANARFIHESGLAAEFARLSEPVLNELDFRLVKISLSGGENMIVQIMAERPDGTMSVGECADLSRALSPLFDAHDPLPGGYRLEISSPGIDRPLVRPSDFEDWAGYDAKIELNQFLDGRKRFRGVLEGFAEGEVRLEVELDAIGRRVLGLPVGLINSAKLVLTDVLIREALKRSKASGKPQESKGGARDDAADLDAQGASDSAEGEVKNGSGAD